MSRWRTLAGLAALLAPACAGPSPRDAAVHLSVPVEIVTVRVGVAPEATAAARPSAAHPLRAADAEDPLRPVVRLLRPRWRLGWEEYGEAPRPVEPEEVGPALGDPRELMATGLGFHLGVGEAPYDDGLHDNALLPVDLVGFSDALVQVYYVQPVLGGAAELVGAVSATRIQDDPLMDALEDPDLAWVTLGLKVRF